MATTISLMTIIGKDSLNSHKLTIINGEKTSEINNRLDNVLRESQKNYTEESFKTERKLGLFILD